MKSKIIQNKVRGENFEYEIEKELRKTFAQDNIKKITIKNQKADYLQEIKQNNKIIGKIIYEIKNAEWKNDWEKKLSQDMSIQGSKYGILVATSFTSHFKGIPFKVSDENPNIYLTNEDSFYFVGHILRNLIKIEYKFELFKNDNSIQDKKIIFNKWKDLEFPKVNKIFEDNFKKMNDIELYIIKKIADLKKSREKILDNWINIIKNFIENFNI